MFRAVLEVLALSEQYLCEITGMDGMSFQPAAGAHGEFTGILPHQGVSQGAWRFEAYQDHRA
jgi:glycine cleavage system protein P-like pyridoxal-binding family